MDRLQLTQNLTALIWALASTSACLVAILRRID
jgi:hypothetical protein